MLNPYVGRPIIADVRLVHEPTDGDARVLATEIETADSLLSQARGLTFRRSIPDDYALAFRFVGAGRRGLHTLFVAVPIDAVWVCDGVVQRVERLRPWRDRASATADTVFELAAGGADGVEAGDRCYLAD